MELQRAQPGGSLWFMMTAAACTMLCAQNPFQVQVQVQVGHGQEQGQGRPSLHLELEPLLLLAPASSSACSYPLQTPATGRWQQCPGLRQGLRLHPLQPPLLLLWSCRGGSLYAACCQPWQ